MKTTKEKKRKTYKIGFNFSRSDSVNPSDYVYPRPEKKRIDFELRIVSAFNKYRPDLAVILTKSGVIFGNKTVLLTNKIALFEGSLFNFSETCELL